MNVGFVLARMLQGIGPGIVVPAALVSAASLIPTRRRGTGLALVASTSALAGIVFPVASVEVLAAGSLQAVAAATVVLVSLGIGLLWPLPDHPVGRTWSGAHPDRVAARRLRWRRQWMRPLAGTALFAIYWGVIAAYLPQRTEAAGLNVGVFFALDGIMVLLLRAPVGWFTDQRRPHQLLLASVAAGVVTMALLLPTPTAALLAIAGVTSGIAAAGFFTVLLAELGRRSSRSGWGSAFALLSASQAAAWLLGSAGTAPVVMIGGFEAAAAVSIAGMLVAGALTLSDPGLGRGPHPSSRVNQRPSPPAAP